MAVYRFIFGSDSNIWFRHLITAHDYLITIFHYRLILDSSADSEKEEDMVEWLRDVGMPADYVNKLARMFQDIKVSDKNFFGHNLII